MTLTDKLNRIRLAAEIGKLLDEDLPETERQKIEAWIDAQPGGSELYAEMASDHSKLRQSLAEPISESELERFTSIIDTEFESRQVDKPGRRLNLHFFPQLAAALVLVAGTFTLTSAWMENRFEREFSELAAHMETERRLLGETIQKALETRISGEAVQVASTGEWSDVLTPIQTYKSKSGHWCRHYIRETHFGDHDMAIRGTACRDEKGVWTTIIAEPVLGDGPLATSGA